MNDVTRGRALLGAAFAAALGLAAALFASDGAGRVLAPAAVSAPHQRAGLSCASCHDAPTPARACSGCHGIQRSARSGHQRLAARGELGCGDCHRSHGAEGISTSSDGALHHFLGEREWSHDAGQPPLAPSASLPLVAAERCAACHDPTRADDPARHCFAAGSGSSLCFDEHGGPPAPGATALEEAARSVALSAAARDRGPSLTRVVLQLGFALAAGLLGLFVVRRRGQRPIAAAPIAATLLAPTPGRARRLPVIDAARCLGCAACVEACPHDVLEVSRHVALVARPDACCGLALCAERCPNGSLSLLEGEPLDDAPRLTTGLESLEQPGVFLAGDVTGQSLIRVAVRQGVDAARAVARSLPRGSGSAEVFDLVIVGAGPAGLAAALEAKRLGLCAVVLEQGRIAESIQSFPRDKIVLDGGVLNEDLPLWVGECTKEELVRRWLRTVRAARLDLRERVRVSGWRRREPERFEIRFSGEQESTVVARRVLLAVGRRGSPQRLAAPIAEEARSFVHYSLSDARRHAGRRVVIVGLGDSAMEAAAALAHQSGTVIDVVYRGEQHRRGKRRNIEEFRRLCAAGRITVHWSTAIARVLPGQVALTSAGAEQLLPFDVLFVLIGGTAGNELLPQAASEG
jgi:thioredoxin reductase